MGLVDGANPDAELQRHLIGLSLQRPAGMAVVVAVEVRRVTAEDGLKPLELFPGPALDVKPDSDPGREKRFRYARRPADHRARGINRSGAGRLEDPVVAAPRVAVVIGDDQQANGSHRS